MEAVPEQLGFGNLGSQWANEALTYVLSCFRPSSKERQEIRFNQSHYPNRQRLPLAAPTPWIRPAAQKAVLSVCVPPIFGGRFSCSNRFSKGVYRGV